MPTDDETYNELQSTLTNVSQFCDFEELGIDVTTCTDVSKTARSILKQNGSSKPVEERIYYEIGIDNCKYYFVVISVHSESFINGRYVWDSSNDYFCLDCESGELTQIYPMNGLDEIECVSDEVMICYSLGDNQYYAIYRDTGFSYKLPDNVTDVVVSDNKVFYWKTVLKPSHLGDVYRSEFCSVVINEGSAFEGTPTEIRSVENKLSRGIYNAVVGDQTCWHTINGNSYIHTDPLERIRDYVTDTYYHGSAIAERNEYGWNTRISIFDRSEKEYVLTNIQTENDPLINIQLKLHSTQSGLIFLKLRDTGPIVIVGSENDFSNVKAAFVPEGILPEYYDVLCDGNTLYFLAENLHSIVTMSYNGT